MRMGMPMELKMELKTALAKRLPPQPCLSALGKLDPLGHPPKLFQAKLFQAKLFRAYSPENGLERLREEMPQAREARNDLKNHLPHSMKRSERSFPTSGLHHLMHRMHCR
jgi:hypothetical protein